MLPLLQKLSLKSLSEQNIKMVAMALLLGITQSHTVKSLTHLVFRLFGQDYDVITWEFPAKIGETPLKS